MKFSYQIPFEIKLYLEIFFRLRIFLENYPSPSARDNFQNIRKLEKISGYNLTSSGITSENFHQTNRFHVIKP